MFFYILKGLSHWYLITIFSYNSHLRVPRNGTIRRHGHPHNQFYFVCTTFLIKMEYETVLMLSTHCSFNNIVCKYQVKCVTYNSFINGFLTRVAILQYAISFSKCCHKLGCNPPQYKVKAKWFFVKVYVHMYVAHNIRRPICDGKFSPTFSIFCKHMSKFTCHPTFSLPERDRIDIAVGCRKSESDTGKQPNINEKGKIHRLKSAVGFREPQTCVCTTN